MPAAVSVFLDTPKERTDSQELTQYNVTAKRQNQLRSTSSLPFSIPPFYSLSEGHPPQVTQCGATAGLDLGNIFALLCHVDLYFVLDRCKSGKNQKCSRCKDKDSDRGIAGSTGSCISNRNDLCSKAFPEPRISLTRPMATRPTVKPRPIPSPSKIDGRTGFLEA